MLIQTENWDVIINPIDVEKAYDCFNTKISELINLSTNSFKIQKLQSSRNESHADLFFKLKK